MRAPRSLLLLLCLACTPGYFLIGAPQALHLRGQPTSALAEAAGVRLVVTGDEWHGTPYDLGQLVTPVHVILENHSGLPLRIRYTEFMLADRAGLQMTALPPYRIQRPGTNVVVGDPFYPSSGFLVAAPYSGYYPGLTPWPGEFDYVPGYYDTYAEWQPALPTADMLRKVLPEGVLTDGGHVQGYLYFQRVHETGEQVQLRYQLINAQTKQPFGAITLPLVVARG